MSKYRIKINGNVYEMEVECIDEAQNEQTVSADVSHAGKIANTKKRSGQTSSVVQIIDPSHNEQPKRNDNVVRSTMPGTILKIMCSNGDTVKKGQPVIVLEAMKMENEITAIKNGIIKEIFVKKGQTVPGGAVLFEIEE